MEPLSRKKSVCAKEFHAISFCSGFVGAGGAAILNRSAVLSPGPSRSAAGKVTKARKAVAAGS